MSPVIALLKTHLILKFNSCLMYFGLLNVLLYCTLLCYLGLGCFGFDFRDVIAKNECIFNQFGLTAKTPHLLCGTPTSAKLQVKLQLCLPHGSLWGGFNL